jgi:hypothetical protein
MTVGGWIMMLASVGGVVALAAWCFQRVLTAPEPDDDA